MHKIKTTSPRHGTISCTDIPDAFLLDKSLIKQHFEKYGKVSRIVIRNKRKNCTVEFETAESAKAAIFSGGNYDGYKFKITYAKIRRTSESKGKSEVKKKVNKTLWGEDSEVMDELEAMKSVYTPGSDVSSRKVGAEKTKPKKDVVKPHRAWKNDKPRKSELALNTNMEQVNEFLKGMCQQATTSEAKYRVLEARDKLMRLLMSRRSELKKVSRTVGTCPDMCPEKERLQRETQHQVSLFEQTRGRGAMDHTIAVKQYSRSSADQESPLPHDLRPVRVLQLTMSYLLHKIMDLSESEDVNIGEWYHFLWDRTRGIRKDITQQELCCQGSVRLVEQCARFHVHCSARLVAEDAGVFDQRINTENLTKCLQTLKYMYADLGIQGVRCQNEPEFRGYIVLLNLNDGNFMWELQQLSPDVQRSQEVRFALQVHSAIDKNNYVRFFKLVKETTYLNACILLRYFNQVRVKALITILKSCAPRVNNFPLWELSNALAFEDEESAIDFLEYYGLPLTDGRTQVILDRKSFCQPDSPYQPDRAIKLVESKRKCSIGEVVCDSSLSNFEPIKPHCSFDVDGYLKLCEVPREWRSKYTSIRNIQHVSDVSDTPETPTISPVKTTETGSVNSNKFIFRLPSNVDVPYTVTAPSKTTWQFQKPTTFQFREPSTFQEASSTSIPKKVKRPVDEPDSTMNIPKFDPTPVTLSSFKPPELTVPKPRLGGFSFENNFKTLSKPPKTTTATSSANVFPKTPNAHPKIVVPEQVSKPLISFTNQPGVVFKPIPDNIPLRTASDIVFKPPQEEEPRRKRTRNELEENESKIRKVIRPVVVDDAKQQIEDQKIKTEIKQLLSDVLKKVETHINKEIETTVKLQLIAQKIKARKLLTYVDKWKSIVQNRKRERNSFLSNPSWVSDRTIDEEAHELRQNSQSISMEDMKTYVTGRRSFSPPKDLFKPVQKLNITQLVWKTLYEQLSKNHPVLHVFWKINIIVETKQVYTLKYLNHLLKNSFGFVNNKSVESHRTENGTKFTYCISKDVDIDKGANGVCCIVDYDCYKSFLTSLKHDKNVPMLVVVFNGSKNETNDSPFEVVHLGRSSVTVPVLIASLQWLAQRVIEPARLEMNSLSDIIQSGAGQELLVRIKRSLTINIRLEIALRDPNTAINLYNNGIKKLGKLFGKFDECGDFPEEFRTFLNVTDVMLPCTYEYFPKSWRDKQTHIMKILETFLLREWTANWPPADIEELYLDLQSYVDNNRAFAKILNTLSYLFKEEAFNERINTISWCDIIEIISIEKVRQLNENDTIYCVYRVDDLEHLRVEPWWYDCMEFMSNIKKVSSEKIDVQTDSDWGSSDESDDEINMNSTILEANEVLVKIDGKKDENLRKELLELKAMVDDLDESLNIQKKISTRFKETANNTLNDI